MSKCAFAVAGALLLAPALVSAQTCVGRPSFDVAPTNISVDATFADGSKGVGGSLAFGGAAGFAGVGLGYTSYSDADASATSFSGLVGTQVKPSAQSKARLCPVAQVTYGYGPNIETTVGKVKTTQLGLLGGVALGGEVEVGEGLTVIPNISGGVLHQRAKVTVAGFSESGNDTGGLIQGGVSLLFNKVLAIAPSVAVPVGFDSNDTVFSIAVVIGLKRGK